MSLFTKLGTEINAPVTSAGVSRGADMLDEMVWKTEIESVVTAFTSNGGLIYETKLQLDSSLSHGQNTSAWVIGDSAVANNGIYRKIGAAGTGSWSRVADLPYSFILATNAGTGTPNAIRAYSGIPVPNVAGATLVAFNITDPNSDFVTVQFNESFTYLIKSNSGFNIIPGGFTPGMIVAGYVASGGVFRLLSDYASAAIVAAAEESAALAAVSATAAAASAANAAAAVPTPEFTDVASARTGIVSATHASCYVRAPGFERKYIRRLGDYSTEVAANPIGELYFAADDVASTVAAFVWEHVDRNDWHPLAGGATILSDSEHGHSWALGGITNPANGETTIFKSRSPEHGTINGTGLWRSISRDYGLSEKDERDVHVDLTQDFRFLNYGQVNGQWQAFVRGTNELSGVDVEHWVFTSTDYFKANITKTEVELISGGLAPHGKLFDLPASLGAHGNDTTGAIIYGYGGSNIRAWYTTAGWATDHTELLSMITPASLGVTSLSEPYVVECGAANRRIGFFRVDTPDDANLYCFNMTDGITPLNVTDTGRYNGGTPPYAQYHVRSDRVYLYRTNRTIAGDFDENFPANALLWTWEDAAHLISTGTIRREWSVAYLLPDFFTGYFYEIEVAGKKMVYGTCAESNSEGPVDFSTSVLSRTQRVLFGQVAVATGTKKRPNPNLYRNERNAHWFDKISFTHSDLTPSTTPLSNGAQICEGLFIAVSAGVTGTVDRVDVPGYVTKLIPGNPRYAVSVALSAGDTATDNQIFIWRFRDPIRYANRSVTFRMFGRGRCPETAKLDIQISYTGSAYDEQISDVAMTGLCMGDDSNDLFVLSGTIPVPDLDGDVISSAGLMEVRMFTTNEATDFDIAFVKIEDGPEATEIVPMSDAETKLLCVQERKVWSSLTAVAFAAGGAFGGAGARAVMNFGDMASTPTVVFSGAASDYGWTGGTNVVCNALPTASDITVRSCEIAATVASGLTTGQFYALRGETADAKIVAATGF